MPYDHLSLPARLLGGDPAAMVQVTRWIAQALAVPRYWALRREWEDVHQEALLRTLESLRDGRFDPSRDLRTYVQGIVHHTASKRLTKLAHERGGVGGREPAYDPVPRLEDHVSLAQIARTVLERLSPACRDLIRTYFIEEASYEEIAARTGMPVGTVKSRLFRCLAVAREILRGREPDAAESE